MAPLCTRLDKTIFFEATLQEAVAHQFLSVLREARSDGCDELTLNFANAERAYPSGLLPMIAAIDREAAEGLRVTIVEPDDPHMRSLFLNTGWSHELAPEQFGQEGMNTARHMGVRRYATAEELTTIVTDAMERILGQVQISEDLFKGLEWSIQEIADNVLEHANTGERGGFFQLVTQEKNQRLVFVVADAGRGILAAMSDGHRDLTTDADAVQMALLKETTGTGDTGRGNGLFGTLRVASETGGAFKLTSGRAQFRLFRDTKTGEYRDEVRAVPPDQAFTGTVVDVTLGLDPAFRLEKALGFATEGTPYQVDVFDTVDASGLVDDGGQAIVRVSDAMAQGFGTRQAGKRARMEWANLLARADVDRLVLDWAGVPLVSSSFADESVGKLFAELGPIGFMQRVQLVNLAPTVASLINHSLERRTR